ncbi:MAG TPA: class I SAM-dependent methyltransferase [Candidatus Bathyarchaeia archaeon]
MYQKSAVYYDAIYSFKNYQKEADKIHQLIQQHKRSSGRTLLDVACGTGGHLAFLRQHYEVEGLDVNPDMLKIARPKHPDMRFHQGEMASFNLKRKFDAIICLFSSIGYVKTKQRLHQTIQNMARHLQPGGVLIIEPWFSPEAFIPGTVHGLWVDKPDLKIARINVSLVKDNVSIMDMHHLVGTPNGVEHFVERHEMALFTHEEYIEAFRSANLEVTYEPDGLTGRGLYVGSRLKQIV